MKWYTTFAAAAIAAIAAVLLVAPAHAAPPKPRLPACTPAQREHWRVTDTNTIVEGRVILVHTSPDGAKRCGEVKVSTARPQAPRKVRK